MVSPSTAAPPAAAPARWFRQLNGYHWLVLGVCTLAWLFDCLNQQIFNLTRKPAMEDLLKVAPGDTSVAFYGGWSTAMLLIGWATGGIIFGMLGDRIGRVKTLLIMILAYSVSTGLCGLAQGPLQYIFFCFVTGVGAGGIFPVGCTLVAESLPDNTRSHALGMLQAFSAIGNVSAGFIWLMIVQLWSHGLIGAQQGTTPWRWIFCVGVLPSLLSIIVARKLREPEAWKKAVADGIASKRKAGSLAELFGDPRWRRRAIVGMLLGASGVIGLWGIGVFSTDLTQRFIGAEFDATARQNGEDSKDLDFVGMIVASPDRFDAARNAKVEPRQLLGTRDDDQDAKQIYDAAISLKADKKDVSAAAVLGLLDQPGKDSSGKDRKPQTTEERATREKLLAAASSGSVADHIARILKRAKDRNVEALEWGAVTLLMFNVGAFFGMYAFARLTHRIGRRPTFAIAFLAAGGTTVFAFLYMHQRSDLFWMVPLMGAAQLSLFGGYAIYFPELFPTRLRSTGCSFCYNVARYVAATGPLGTGLLTSKVFAHAGSPVLATRYAGAAMCSCFLVGLVTLLFAPETKGLPLPE